MNRVKEKLRRGETVLVFNSDFPSPAMIEYAGGLGFDAAFIDCEHGTADFERVEDVARAARASGMTSVLRAWSNEPGLVTRYLDCGIGGVQFPRMEDAATAREMVDIVRTARGARSADTLVAGMIESARAVDNLAGIVEVEGVDAVVVGMADLARSLGHAGDPRHAEVQATVTRIIETVHAAGGTLGINLHHWEEGGALQEQGVRWFTIHGKAMLDRGARQLYGLLDMEGRGK